MNNSEGVVNISDKTIAVLPLVNMSPYADTDYFSDGMTDEIITALSRIPGLLVTSRTSSFAFKEKDISIREIAQTLGVKTIVEGSVRRAEGDVRITIQLINAEDDFHYWSETYTHKYENLFHIQNQIAIDVAERFRETAGHFNIADQLIDEKAKNMEAYELMLRARHHINDLSREGVEKGIDLMMQALDMEPDNPSFLATQAIYFTVFGLMGAMPSRQAYSIAIKAANKSLSINPNDVNANSAIAFLSFCYDGDLEKFDKHCTKALEAGPNDPPALIFKSMLEAVSGNYEKSMDAINRAAALDPMSPMPIYIKASNLSRMRRWEECLETLEGFLKVNPFHLNAYNTKGIALTHLGRLEEAIAHYEKMPISPEKTVPYAVGLGIAHALKGNSKEAEEYLHLATSETILFPLAHQENPKVAINFLLGRKEEAFEALAKDIEERAYYLKFYRSNPIFDKMREDQRGIILDRIFISEMTSKKADKKYAKSGLSAQEMNQIEEKLKDVLQEEKPYLDADLSLKKLAELVGTTSNHLSQVINSKSKKNFFDFINSYRIEELKSLMNNPSNQKFTMLSLAFEAGFKSKSTFNASFKKLTGLTPTEYAKTKKVS